MNIVDIKTMEKGEEVAELSGIVTRIFPIKEHKNNFSGVIETTQMILVKDSTETIALDIEFPRGNTGFSEADINCTFSFNKLKVAKYIKNGRENYILRMRGKDISAPTKTTVTASAQAGIVKTEITAENYLKYAEKAYTILASNPIQELFQKVKGLGYTSEDLRTLITSLIMQDNRK